jgi:antitoxin component YwqK of YwqJK toxin-antitoxin module
MKTSSNFFGRPANGSVAPGVWLIALVLAGIAAWAFVHLRSAVVTNRTVDLPEVARRELLFTNGLSFRRGDTNPFTGLMVEHYATGSLRSKTFLTNGLLNGTSRGWHTNGQLQVEEFFVNGVSHGTRTRWRIDGTRESEATIEHGVIVGVFRRWHTNGTLAQEITMSNGVPHGVSRAWAPDGTLQKEVELTAGVVVANASRN